MADCAKCKNEGYCKLDRDVEKCHYFAAAPVNGIRCSACNHYIDPAAGYACGCPGSDWLSMRGKIHDLRKKTAEQDAALMASKIENAHLRSALSKLGVTTIANENGDEYETSTGRFETLDEAIAEVSAKNNRFSEAMDREKWIGEHVYSIKETFGTGYAITVTLEWFDDKGFERETKGSSFADALSAAIAEWKNMSGEG